MGKLAYDKWDKLELSDDSDIEEHPNIDKRSMINWKKRDILEKRNERKQRIANYRMEVELNAVLQPRMETLRAKVDSAITTDAKSTFTSEVHRLTVSPSSDKPATGHAKQPTYDEMLLDLYKRVMNEAKTEMDAKKEDIKDDRAWQNRLVERMRFHEEELKMRSKECTKLADQEEEEQKKKITSEDVREGYSSGHVLKPTPSPLEEPKKVNKGKGKEVAQPAETSFEVLNPGTKVEPISEADQTDSDDAIPTLTPSALRFSLIPVRNYSASFAFIQSDPSVLLGSTTDALLGAAFEAELKGEKEKARRCVHQGLLIQYCRKLGKDGVRLFFQRMEQAGPKAEAVFQNDVEDTYRRMEKRVVEMKAEQINDDGDREQIQLVAEDENAQIGFNIPDGPPPDDLRLEGEGTEGLDVAEVKKFLQMKWDLFRAFPKDLQEAMKEESLVKVNKVLGRMKVAQAEEVVEQMQEGGMLSFGESGVRDMTGADEVD